MSQQLPYKIFPLGNTAIIVDYGNLIDDSINKEVIARFRQLKADPIPGMIEVVPAYSSLAIYYDLQMLFKKKPESLTVYDWVKGQIELKLKEEVNAEKDTGRIIRIPVCYENEFAPDLVTLAAAKKLSLEEVISIHCSKKYKIYMLGFIPGFAYMGEVDERIVMPRKQQPQMVTAGSVGIAGKQTGIYPLASPGGWQIIGTTPLKMFDPEKDDPTVLHSGDLVEFYSISSDEFKSF
jgi:inhibitor of KinA